MWLHHTEFAYRAGELAEHLTAALELADRGRYATAYAVLRTALEHQTVDRLLLLATRFRQRIGPLDDAEFAQLRAEFDARSASWTESTASFEREGRGAVLVRQGHDVRNTETGKIVEHVSPYHVVLEGHDATLGPPDAQEALADGLTDPQLLKDRAQENRKLYRGYLTWAAITDNLVLNGLLGQDQVRQLDVHYRFLSAFTHATRTGYEAVAAHRGHPGFGRPPHHCMGELVLLYAATIVVEELRTFVAFVAERPKLVLTDEAEVLRAVETAGGAAAHLWFPGGTPTAYDQFREAHRRAWRSRDSSASLQDALRPDQIPLGEVAYYPDPLDRLVRMHQSVQEVTTGFVYRPPW